MDLAGHAVLRGDRTPTASFKIADIPPGDYEVEIWQETLGKKTEKTSIKAKEETKAAFELSKG